MDHAITDFLTCKPTGAIVQLGVGLETTYYHDRTLWYGIDLPHVIEHRKALLDNANREILVAGDAFEPGWLGLATSCSYDGR